VWGNPFSSVEQFSALYHGCRAFDACRRSMCVHIGYMHPFMHPHTTHHDLHNVPTILPRVGNPQCGAIFSSVEQFSALYHGCRACDVYMRSLDSLPYICVHFMYIYTCVYVIFTVFKTVIKIDL
jgi:hypothetical protein